MNVLDLCAGYGGFSLALKLLGDSFRTICYVERDAFCQAVLVARMEEKALDPAPFVGAEPRRTHSPLMENP